MLAGVLPCAAETFTLTTLKTFATAEGSSPYDGLQLDPNGTTLYGACGGGGSANTDGYYGGTLFKIQKDGSGFSVIHRFNPPNVGSAYNIGGSIPGYTPILVTSDGYLYGVTVQGGSEAYGVFYKVKPDATGYTVLKEFDGLNSASPQYATNGVIRGSDGYFYGGGNSSPDSSILYKIATTSGSAPTAVHLFASGNLYGQFMQASNGKLYGIVSAAGNSGVTGGVVSVTTDGSTFTTLHSFSDTDGGHESYSGLIQGSNGTLYGTIYNYSTYVGTIFKIQPDGTGFTVLHTLAAGTEGQWPVGNLLLTSDGYLYGATSLGGANSYGTIFRLKTDGTGCEVVHTFAGGTDHAFPNGSLIVASDGKIYGTTSDYNNSTWSSSGNGSVFAITIGASTPAVLSVSPTSGPTAGGTSVTITGTDLTGATSVTFGSTAATSYTVNSAGTITAVSPVGSAGTVDITVTTAGGTSATSSSDQFTYAVAPGAPIIGTAIAGNTQATVSFTAPTGGASITSYTVTSSPGNITATGSASPISVTGLTNGTAYTFTVTATNAGGTGSPSAASTSVTPMGTTTTTVASSLNPSTYDATVTFTATVLPSTATGTVTFKDGSTTLGTGTLSSGTATLSTSALTATSHAISAVYGGDTAYTTSTSSTLTQTVNAVAPGAPTIGTATGGNAQATVTFTAPAFTGGGPITGYTVTSSPGGFSASGNGSPLVVSGLTNGTTYTFTVTATNSASLTSVPSTASNEVTPTADTIPPVIAVPTFSNLGAGQVTLTLTSSETGTGYFTILSPTETAGTAMQTQAGQNAAGIVTRHGSLALTAAAAGSYTVRNLAAETTYTVAFTAKDVAGNLAPVQTATFTTLAARALAGMDWKTVGNAGFSAGWASSPSLVLAADGTPYVAYADGGNSNKATVMKYNGSAWVLVGSAGFSAGSTWFMSLALAPDGTPYVAYNDSGNSNKATVMKYNGSSWVTVGNAGLSAGLADSTSLALAPDGTPYVAYTDGGNSNKATVMKYNGSAWVPVGSAGFSTGYAGRTSLALAADGTPYVAYQDIDTDSKMTVMKYNGGAWALAGSAGFSAGADLGSSLALAPDGTPYVAYSDFDGTTGPLTVMKLTPAVTSVAVPVAGTYGIGANLVFTANYSSPVTVTGVPELPLTIGSLTRVASYDAAHSTSTALAFTYTVVSGDLDTDGIVLGSALSLSGGALNGSDGYPALLALHAIDSTTGVLIDGVVPATPTLSGIAGVQASGTAEAGSTVKIYDGATLLATTIAVSDGTWQVSLPDGSYANLTVAASDAAGNTASSSATAQTVDGLPPTITSELTAAGTYRAEFSYTITATDTNGLRYSTYNAESLPSGLSVDSVTGVISGTPMQAGTFPITLSAFDAYNNKGTATLTLTVAKAARTIVFYPLFDQIYDPNSTARIYLYGSASFNFPVSYSVAGPATIAYDSAYYQYYLTLTGTGTVTVTASLAGDENYTAAADVTQSFKIQSPATVTLSNASLTVTYDGQPHGVTATTTPAGLPVVIEYYNMGKKSLSAELLDGAATAKTESVYTMPPTAVGNYVVDAWIDDATYEGGIDGSLTIIPATPTTPATTTNNTTPVLSGIADPGATVNVYDGTTLLGSVTASAAAEGATTGTWSFTPTTALTQGTHLITIKEVISTGKSVSLLASKAKLMSSESAASAALELVVDMTAPSAPVFTTTSGYSVDNKPTLTGTAETSATVKLYDGTTLLSTMTANATTGMWSFALTTALTEGTHTLTATAIDAAGNVSAASEACTMIVGSAPTITAAPASKTVAVGSSVTLTATATGTATLNYEWQRSIDGTTYTTVANGTTSSYSLTSVAVANTGYYRVIVNNAFAPAVTSASAYLSVTPAFAAPKPDGYAAAVTGGSAGTSVTVLTAADFKTQVTSATACTITVVGQLSIGTVSVASNKTIQGADADAALLGNLTLASGISNVVIRGLNLTNPGTIVVNGVYTDGGDALTITGASKVFVTHCTFFDCADHNIKITTGADNITVSWSEFYASAATLLHRYSMQIGGTAESQTSHVTLHHNLWSTNLDQRMPFTSYGIVHQFNNLVIAAHNTGGSVASDHAQFLSERNVYTGVVSPLTKQEVSATIIGFAAGKIRSIGNVYTSCTGTAPDVGTDTVFTPPYSYELLPASDVATEVLVLAGNIAGASTTDAATSTATISGPTAAVTPGASFTLTAVPTGFTAATYQWRLNNVDITGAISATYTSGNTQAANAGTYTVAISLASSDTVVSAPFSITLGEQPTMNGRISGGGGALGTWYCAALALLGSLRFLRRRCR